ncbi:MAG: hypothetical protein WBG16_01060 [Bradyrhizobium sp.]|jgi:hypothetical protein|uniref:hypothetical protein n=1 Tax=Bradyrhizobium sp. TaxID=376 RepID=UPI003C36004C
MRTVFQIKFKSSVAGALHPAATLPCPIPNWNKILWQRQLGERPILTIRLAVDHPGSCGLH